ncbi:MAG: tRNA (guanosine(46)-N7)-methyltransferase TrmB [Bacteroidales bacterium]|nr:tRNA (guanosine(46)-N7)-methyltransferase TrmB [Bacteroidales bacterium]
MSKRKLRNFAETFTFNNFFQPTYPELIKGFPLKGKWNTDFFKNKNPIIIELGCGKGEYTVGLAKMHPENNYIGMDIKGARMWRGCKTSIENGYKNVGFIRHRVELLEHFFLQDELSEIWITFPEPQPKISKRRLTSPRFLNIYNNILKPDGIIHLKTDNIDLFNYTLEIIEENNHKLLLKTNDFHNSILDDEIKQIQTFYEKIFIKKGIPINYLEFRLK